MTRQLALSLTVRPALGREDFFVTGANAIALAEIDRWQDWPQGKLALTGPEGSGKTHLAHVWAAASGARITAAADLPGRDLPPERTAMAVENVDRIGGDAAAEEALFHLHNHLLATGGRLLVTGREAPARWPLALPDLMSRMQATAIARIEPPDDALLAALLVKLFTDRQIPPAPRLIDWLVPRIERSAGYAGRLVAMIDQMALESRRAIGPALAAEAMERLAV